MHHLHLNLSSGLTTWTHSRLTAISTQIIWSRSLVIKPNSSFRRGLWFHHQSTTSTTQSAFSSLDYQSVNRWSFDSKYIDFWLFCSSTLEDTLYIQDLWWSSWITHITNSFPSITTWLTYDMTPFSPTHVSKWSLLPNQMWLYHVMNNQTRQWTTGILNIPQIVQICHHLDMSFSLSNECKPMSNCQINRAIINIVWILISWIVALFHFAHHLELYKLSFTCPRIDFSLWDQFKLISTYLFTGFTTTAVIVVNSYHVVGGRFLIFDLNSAVQHFCCTVL